MLDEGGGRAHPAHMELGAYLCRPPGDGWRALRGGNAHPVATVVGLVASRLSAEEITAEYPQLAGGCEPAAR